LLYSFETCSSVIDIRQPRGRFDLAGPRQHRTQMVQTLSVAEELRAGDISVCSTADRREIHAVTD
jgi:hypothetical protein